MKRILASACVLIGFAAVAADPQPIRQVDRPMTKEEARFRALDTNNDQELSPEEFHADTTSPTEFAKLDTDADGGLSLAEFTARPIPPAKKPNEQR